MKKSQTPQGTEETLQENEQSGWLGRGAVFRAVRRLSRPSRGRALRQPHGGACSTSPLSSFFCWFSLFPPLPFSF